MIASLDRRFSGEVEVDVPRPVTSYSSLVLGGPQKHPRLPTTTLTDYSASCRIRSSCNTRFSPGLTPRTVITTVLRAAVAAATTAPPRVSIHITI